MINWEDNAVNQIKKDSILIDSLTNQIEKNSEFKEFEIRY